MVEIIPAVLPKSYEELETGLRHLHGVSKIVQVDLVGENILKGHEAMPLWQEFDFECDIMVPKPGEEVQPCIDIGARRLVIHPDSAAKDAAYWVSAEAAIQAAQLHRGGDYGVLLGIALANSDSVGALSKYTNLYDFVQVMGIDHIGSQGQPFDPQALTLISALRAAHPQLSIQVDGGAAEHVKELVQAGANRIVIGSAIMQAADPKAAYKALYTEANS
jgi:pentose-5-phosphate-3-epimerase